MYSKKQEPEEYYKYLLNKKTITPNIVAHIESLTLNDDAPKFAFHKIMINNWPSSFETLFDTLSDYFTTALIPVNPSVQDEITTFYTSNLNLILKIIKLDFNFLYERNIVNIDIIYSDKTSIDFFNRYETISDIVSGVVNRRFCDKELDLSDFSNDAEFLTKKIFFYKLGLLSHFKILMLRIGKETVSLNLSNNNLSETPSTVINFFIKGNLNAVNLSNNNIKSLSKVFAAELYPYKNQLEKLWLEGNPLCEELEPWTYFRRLVWKFPRLVQLDGVTIDPKESIIPFVRNYLLTPDQRTKVIIDKFVSLFFRYYDEPKRPRIGIFYKGDAKFSIVANIPEEKESVLLHYAPFTRNILHAIRKEPAMYKGRFNIVRLVYHLPRTVHDRTTFTVDLIRHDETSWVLVVDGVFKEPSKSSFYTFRRTFHLCITKPKRPKNLNMTAINIRHEMFQLSYVERQVKNFTFPTYVDPIMLINPDEEEKEALLKIFSHVSYLKKPEAERRLEEKNWDLRGALIQVLTDLQQNKAFPDDFMIIDEPDTSHACSIIDMVD